MSLRLLAFDDADDLFWCDMSVYARGIVKYGLAPAFEQVRVATVQALPTNELAGGVLTAVANGSINGSGIDGLTDLAVNDRVLVRAETDAEKNGVYVVTDVGDGSNPWVLTRSMDADAESEFRLGRSIRVGEGAETAGRIYLLVKPPAELDVDPVRWSAAGIVATASGSRFLREDGVWSSIATDAEAILAARVFGRR